MNIILFEHGETAGPLKKRDERAIHLLKVLHKRAGDEFDAGILGDRLGTGRIESIGPDGSLFFSLALGEDPPPRIPIRLAVGFPRPIQLRRLLRDLSNLGLAAIDLLGTDLGEKSYRDTNLLNDGGARAALIEGAVQARDTGLPILRVFPDTEAWLADILIAADNVRPKRPPTGAILIAADNVRPKRPPTRPILIAADNVRPQGPFAELSPGKRPLVIAVGSERGWSDRERELLEAAGFLRLSLGPRALRTETACVAAAVLAMEKIGALG